MTQFLVFDNSPLSHFARAGKLNTLEELVHGYRCFVPVEVREEIVKGMVAFPDIAEALVVPWLEPIEIAEFRELAAFARYKSELGGGPHENTGEAAVLAWTSVHGGVAVIDERAGSRLAQRDGRLVQDSMWLVAQGVQSGILDRSEAENLVDDLRATDMRLPVNGKEFFAWAYQKGLIP
ncbi:hypothetical protein [Candidatus Poriferisocius sp.]|uniref:hypothetical protein n=1 Tax=Candidatus Poriferisocius sp. TaxID=3101276 RepID=UPI003B0209D7